jgi:hypothetical protein
MEKVFVLCLFIISQVAFASVRPAFAGEEQQVYGWQLMDEQERAEHRNKMRSFQTEQEREAYRMEHHERMQERAREQGMALPDEPTPRGKGMGGPGPGMGAGPGPGGGGKGR